MTDDETTELPDQAPTMAAWALADESAALAYPHSWHKTGGVVAAIIAAVALLTGAVGLTAWALRPQPVATPPMVPALPLQAMVPSTVTAAAPVAPVPTVTVTQSAPNVPIQAEPPDPAPRTFTAAQEQQWSQRASAAGFVPTAGHAKWIAGAEAVCLGLDNGVSYAQMRADVTKNAPAMMPEGTVTYIAIAVRVLCPDHEEVLP